MQWRIEQQKRIFHIFLWVSLPRSDPKQRKQTKQFIVKDTFLYRKAALIRIFIGGCRCVHFCVCVSRCGFPNVNKLNFFETFITHLWYTDETHSKLRGRIALNNSRLTRGRKNRESRSIPPRNSELWSSVTSEKKRDFLAASKINSSKPTVLSRFFRFRKINAILLHVTRWRNVQSIFNERKSTELYTIDIKKAAATFFFT